MKEKIKRSVKTVLRFILNPRLLLCFGIAWMITNGWAYILFGIGSILKNSYIIGAASAYLAFLWIPATPEKIVTFAIAVFLLKKLFPNDKKTLGILKQLSAKLKQKKLVHDENKKQKKDENRDA